MRLVGVIGYEKGTIGRIWLTMGTADIPIAMILPVIGPTVALTAAVNRNSEDIGESKQFSFCHPGAIDPHFTDISGGKAPLFHVVTNQVAKKSIIPLATG